MKLREKISPGSYKNVTNKYVYKTYMFNIYV